MSDFRYPHLFEPIVLGRQFFRNRIFNSPTGVAIEPERYSCAYYERKAIGGAASVCIGDACPNENGRARGMQAADAPAELFDQKIIVPFCRESELSGLG